MNNLTLGKKIGLGFGILVLISAILGGMSVWRMRQAEAGSKLLAQEYVPEMAVSAQVRGAANRVMYAMRGYGFTEDERFLAEAREELVALETGLNAAEELRGKAGHLAKLGGQLKDIEQAEQHYRDLVDQTVAAIGAMAQARELLDRNAQKYMAHAEEYLDGQHEKFERDLAAGASAAKLDERMGKILSMSQVVRLGNEIRVGTFKSQALREPELMIKAERSFPLVEARIGEARAITTQAQDMEMLDEIDAAARGYREAMNTFLSSWKTLQDLGAQRDATGREVIAACKILQDAAEEQTIAISSESASNLTAAVAATLVGLLVAVAVGVLLAIFLTRSITAPVHRVIRGMLAGSEQVSSAASQVSATSQQLASGASEQAASLEETSASLSMMSDSARSSAESSGDANSLTRKVKSRVEEGRDAMTGLVAAMEKIKNSSDETARIIKTIDEIAFQTNLLALNAAVEAARAGDAGKGFAVVAEEVRNLAQRSAVAAKDTSALIAGAQQNSDLGVQATGEMSSILADVVNGIVEVSGLIDELSQTADAQARSVSEVSSAMSQMDQVTQTNAAGAEESASASEELSAQAQEMQALVEQLVSIVGGGATLHAHGPLATRLTGGFKPKAASAKPRASFKPAAKTSTYDSVADLDDLIMLDDEDSLLEI
ncbi:MAG TPA: methyl-accepting chemotaxis protein [Candidatus Krumholzibacteria bacterium]|nr:methyl-accepting chemotaxis protein [Candidatus Krumholzibacteria bacterium]HRX50958.1 methyl-accepting chemotaxis protein [Candidatus Krumholzibacteria bacterium]